MFAIEVKNIRKKYGKADALKGVSFNIKKGEIFGLLGPNGAGKTTTINILADLVSKDSGKVSILGKDPKLVKDKMNVSTAYSHLAESLTVYQNLRVYSKIYNVKDYKKRIDYLLDLFDISYLRNKKTYALSTGQNIRLNLCKALINNPSVLLLDECTVGLDPHIAHKTRQIIKNLQKKQKTTIIFTSHLMYEVEELCNRVAFLSHGKILKIGTVNSLKKSIKKQIVRIDFYRPKRSVKKFLEKLGTNILYIKGNQVSIGVENTPHKLHKLIHPILKAGFKIKDLHIRKPNLEDVFIKIAREKL